MINAYQDIGALSAMLFSDARHICASP